MQSKTLSTDDSSEKPRLPNPAYKLRNHVSISLIVNRITNRVLWLCSIPQKGGAMFFLINVSCAQPSSLVHREMPDNER